MTHPPTGRLWQLPSPLFEMSTLPIGVVLCLTAIHSGQSDPWNAWCWPFEQRKPASSWRKQPEMVGVGLLNATVVWWVTCTVHLKKTWVDCWWLPLSHWVQYLWKFSPISKSFHDWILKLRQILMQFSCSTELPLTLYTRMMTIVIMNIGTVNYEWRL